MSNDKVKNVKNQIFSLKTELVEFMVSAGIESLYELIEKQITSFCGEHYKHVQDREFVRWSIKKTKLILGGKKIEIKHNRIRNVKNGTEKELKILKDFKNIEPLFERVFENMTMGISTRKHNRSLEVNSEILHSSCTSKSSVSRAFVAKTTEKLETWLNEEIAEEYPFLMIDAIVFKNTTVVIALGVKKCGNKKVLGAWEGSTENTRLCTDLLNNLIERGLDVSKIKLTTIDGSKAIYRAIKNVMGNDSLIQRCQIHKKRNVLDYLPKHLHATTYICISQAYECENYENAKKKLKNLANRLKKDFPKATNSLNEGLEETLTLIKLGAHKKIRKTLSTTNPIESLNAGIRYVTKRVKRWRNSDMVMRWVYTGISESEKNFRKINGVKHIDDLLYKIEVYKKKELDEKLCVA